MSNPVLNFDRKDYAQMRGSGCTLQGVAGLTLLYLAFVVVSALLSWRHFETFNGYIAPLAFGTLGIGIVASSKPKLDYLLGPLYAFLEGLLIGLLSKSMEELYPGIVMESVICTFGIALSCGIFYFIIRNTS